MNDKFEKRKKKLEKDFSDIVDNNLDANEYSDIPVSEKRVKDKKIKEI